MLIEHVDARRLIDDTYKETGKVSAYHIEIDKEGLHSAWTPVQERADAFLVVEASGRESYLYTDEMDNYARMFMVPADNIKGKEHQRDIVNPENLPGVGHLYRQERERLELQEQTKKKIEQQKKQDIEVGTTYYGTVWEKMNSVNRRYGNIYDTGEGKGAYIQSQLKSQFPVRAYDQRAKGEVKLPLYEDLERYTDITGRMFVPSLDHEASHKERRLELVAQLRKGLFLEEQGYLPEVGEDNAFDSETEEMLIYSLKDRSGLEVAEVKVLFPESEGYTGCVADPIVVEVSYPGSGDMLEFEDDLDKDPLAQAFMTYLHRSFDDDQWVVDPDNVESRRHQTSLDREEDLTSFMEFSDATNAQAMLTGMSQVPAIGEAIKDHMLALEKQQANQKVEDMKKDESKGRQQDQDLDQGSSFSP